MRPSLRLRLTLTYVALLAGGTALLLAMSWWLLGRHLARTLPPAYADAVLERLAWQYVLAVVGAALVAVGVGWLVAGRALAPLRSIAATARRISEDRLDARVRHDGPADEVGELAATFDAMLDRVEVAVDGQRRFVANASHELRTPLTVIRAEAEVALDDPGATVESLRDSAEVIVETTERTERLLDGLLVLAVASRGAHADDLVDLAAVSERSLAAVRPEAEAAGIAVHAQLPGARVRGDGPLLERLVGNLVENAVRHGRRGGDARVTLETAGGEALLRVRNDGAPIAPELLPRLAEPFERLGGRSGRGTGLGLAIAREVAEAHGGTLALAAPPEGGLDAQVRLPAATVTGT